jgi:flavodoxin
MTIQLIYASRGSSAKRVAESISENIRCECKILCVNNIEIFAQNLIFDYLIVVCPTYGDEELESDMEDFLLKSNWDLHLNKKFSVCELGLYRGYKEINQGAGRIISNFLESKGLCIRGNILSVDSIPLEDFTLIEKWSKNLL